jgi:hypothetical protein
MKKLFSKMLISITLMLFMTLFCTSVFANERMKSFQFSAYIGPVLNLSSADAGGMHSALGDLNPTPNSDLMYASVKGMEMEQDVLWGINGRYYWDSYVMDIGIDMDLSVSLIESPVQDVWVDGMGLSPQQPESDSDILSFSIGPIFRYQGAGIFAKFNPYISPSVSLHYGQANKVSFYPFDAAAAAGGARARELLYPEYGKFESSTIKGIGYGIKAGGEYFINDNLGFFIEFRYTKSDIAVDKSRSYKDGLDYKLHTSSILIGTSWCF